MDEAKRNINMTSTNKDIKKDSKKRLAKYIKPNEAYAPHSYYLFGCISIFLNQYILLGVS
jgi:hypothetical protein